MPDTTRPHADHAEYLSTVEEILDDARNGRMFILVDDESRENEGDLVIPAQMATPDVINFMDALRKSVKAVPVPEKRRAPKPVALHSTARKTAPAKKASRAKTG